MKKIYSVLCQKLVYGIHAGILSVHTTSGLVILGMLIILLAPKETQCDCGLKLLSKWLHTAYKHCNSHKI